LTRFFTGMRRLRFLLSKFSKFVEVASECRMVRLLRDRRRISRKDDLMAEGINRDEVETLARNGAQVVEVLGAKEYEHAHIAGAINLPLTELNRQSASVLIRDRMVIVYCYDYQ
jgi:hypothetical protein